MMKRPSVVLQNYMVIVLGDMEGTEMVFADVALGLGALRAQRMRLKSFLFRYLNPLALLGAEGPTGRRYQWRTRTDMLMNWASILEGKLRSPPIPIHTHVHILCIIILNHFTPSFSTILYFFLLAPPPWGWRPALYLVPKTTTI